MTLYSYFIAPFADYGFMRRALTVCLALAISGAPLGIFLVLRRMTLVGDAISHAILPGASLAFIFYGLSLGAMTIGGLAAGLIIALVAGALTRWTQLKEDASFTGTYLLSLAIGVLIISMHGSSVDLMHVLFGNVLAIDKASLLLVCSICTISLLVLALIYRSLVVECFDSAFMLATSRKGAWIHQLFLVLLVLNLVAAFQALGTLMALGVMILPAIASRFWTQTIDTGIAFAIIGSAFASFCGLLLSYHYNFPSGPSIVLSEGVLYIGSVLFGRYGSIASQFIPQKHFAS